MSTSLFLDQEHKLEFSKIAMPVALSDAPENWQREVASEIYKQIPYIGDYAVNIVIERVNPERGYGFGSAEVTAKSDAPVKEQSTLPKITIPLIIKDRQLQPMDVFMDGTKVFPLTEERLHEHLFRTATFETSTRQPQDRGMADQLYPPMRSNYGNNAMSSGEGGMGKLAASDDFLSSLEAYSKRPTKEKDAGEGEDPTAYMRRLKSEGNAQKFASAPIGGSLLDAIAHTVPEAEVDTFVEHVAQDDGLKMAMVKSRSFREAMLKIAGFNSPSIEKTAGALVNSIKPNIVQLQKLASGNWMMKWAASGAYLPTEEEVSPEQAEELTGGDADIQGAQPGSTITLSTAKAKKTSLTEPEITVIDHFGRWKTYDAATNQAVEGWAIPVMDFEMHELPLHLFIAESGAWALQDDIAGSKSDLGTYEEEIGQMIGQTPPQGAGAFIVFGEDGLSSLLPVTVRSTTQGPDGSIEYLVNDTFGQDITLVIAPGLTVVQQLGDGHYAIPDSVKWMSLQGEPAQLMENPNDVQALFGAQSTPNTVSVGSTGEGEFNMEGAPVEKLASKERQFIKTAEAEFLLVGMGMNPFDVGDVLNRASKGEKVKVAGLNPLIPLSHLHTEMTKKASKMLEEFPYGLQRNLVKEAAVLEDSETADKILAMNFINPENVATFASYLPDLDATNSKLAEMLVASRLGLNQIPTGAVESAMKNLEEVMKGVKYLQQKELV